MEKREIEIVAVCKICKEILTEDFPRGVKNPPATVKHDCQDREGFVDEAMSEIPGVFVTDGTKKADPPTPTIDTPPAPPKAKDGEL